MPQTTLLISQADFFAWKRVRDDGTILANLAGTPLETSGGGSGFVRLGSGKNAYHGQTYEHHLDENGVELLSSENVVPQLFTGIAGDGGWTNIFQIEGSALGVNKINPVTMALLQTWPPALFTGFTAGVFGTQIGFGALTVSPDESILYFTASQKGAADQYFGVVNRFDLANSVMLSALVSEPGTFLSRRSTGLLTLPNGDIIVGWSVNSGHGIRRYTPAGAMVLEYTGFNVYNAGDMGWHLQLGHNNSFWVHRNTPDSFVEIDYDTGAVLKTILLSTLQAQDPDPTIRWWEAFLPVAPTPAPTPSGGCEGEVNTRFGGRRVGKSSRVEEEWYCCMRCGRSFPYSKMKMQNGLQVCHGPGTTKCADEPGHSAAVKRLNLPFEERPRPLPWEDEDL